MLRRPTTCSRSCSRTRTTRWRTCAPWGGGSPRRCSRKGLPAALEAQARKSTLPVTVEPDGVGRYAQEIEATVYFCVLEAMQNIAKYARADTGTIWLADRAGRPALEGSDDGVGVEPA